MVEVDVDALLRTGHWRSSRAKSPGSRFFDTTSSPSRPSHDHATPRSLPYTVKLPFHHYPPPPSVEDETESLAKEYGSSVSVTSEDDPPCRGDPDQYPIVMEADAHTSDDSNTERRFVLVTSASESSDSSTLAPEKKPRRRPKSQDYRAETESSTSYEANTCRKYDTPKSRDDQASQRQEARSTRDSHHRKLNNLPPIITDVGDSPEPRPERREPPRAKSTTRIDRRGEDYFSPRLSSRLTPGSTLTPDVIEHSTKGRDRQFYNGGLSPNAQSQMRSASYRDHYGRRSPNELRNRDRSPAASHPASPSHHKRSSAELTPRGSRRLPKDGSELLRPRPEMPAPKLERRRSTYSRTGRDFTSQHSAGSGEKKTSLLYPEPLHSSDEDQRPPSDRHHQRRRTALPVTQKADYLDAPSESPRLTRRWSREPSPMPSPMPSPQFSHVPLPEKYSPAASPRTGTFPKQLRIRREDERQERPVSRGAPVRSASNVSVTRGSSSLASPTQARRSTGLPPPLAPPPPPKTSSVAGSLSSASPPPSSPPPRYSWHPPKFEPPPRSSAIVVGGRRDHQQQQPPPPSGITTSYRRFSLSELPDIPPCPRTRPEAGHADWLTLPRCEGFFHICPSCYAANFAGTEFRHHFVPAPLQRPHQHQHQQNRPVACDFGASQYYHIAWLFTRKYGRADLGLFAALARVAASTPPCPGPVPAPAPAPVPATTTTNTTSTAAHAHAHAHAAHAAHAPRIWYSVQHPRTRRPVRQFRACDRCARAVEALLPSLTGLFVPLDPPAEPPTRGVCALHQRQQEEEEGEEEEDAAAGTDDAETDDAEDEEDEGEDEDEEDGGAKRRRNRRTMTRTRTSRRQQRSSRDLLYLDSAFREHLQHLQQQQRRRLLHHHDRDNHHHHHHHRERERERDRDRDHYHRDVVAAAAALHRDRDRDRRTRRAAEVEAEQRLRGGGGGGEWKRWE
ncbi:hypothetical protein GGR56DRAFT_98656 [Xylariaceae sp. FL0804]|nr:hypothetical protein GGR56DRAFT_98656 [Xylariaceae sp. FL0804]